MEPIQLLGQEKIIVGERKLVNLRYGKAATSIKSWFQYGSILEILSWIEHIFLFYLSNDHLEVADYIISPYK